MIFVKRGWILGVAAVAAAVGGVTSVAAADVIGATSTGYGVNAQVGVLGNLVSLSTGQVGSSTGVAPAAYSSIGSLAIVNANASVTGILTIAGVTGLAYSNAMSTVDGSMGAKTTSASAEVLGLGLNVGTVSLPLPLFGTSTTSLVQIGGSVIDASASITGDSGSLSVVGDSTLAGLTLSVNGIALNLGAYLDVNGHAAPNTTLDVSVLGIAGLTVVLNEQVVTPESISVNAIHVSLSSVSVLGLGLVNGDVTIGHAEASESFATNSGTAVPEPASLGLLGLSSVGLLMRRRRR